MARQISVLDALEADARRAADPVRRCAEWLAVRRQARGYERYLRPWMGGVGFAGAVPAIAEHSAELGARLERSEIELARFDCSTRQQAGARTGLRLAVIGKGGTGKTVLAAALARLLARLGRRVLAVDLDTNPGLAISLGMAPTDAGLPPDAIEERAGANYGWQLATGLTPFEVVQRFSTPGPDGIRFLGVGKIDSPSKLAAKRSVPAIVQVLLGVGSPDWDVIADLEAGPTTPFERYHAFASDVMVVVGPAWRSAMTARRLLPMVDDANTMVIASQFGAEADHPGLPPWARIPFDPTVRDAERRGLSPLDACPDSPAMRSVDRMAQRLVTAKMSGPRQLPGAQIEL